MCFFPGGGTGTFPQVRSPIEDAAKQAPGGIQGTRDKNGIIRQMKNKAIKWARDNNIPFVDNLDINPYN